MAGATFTVASMNLHCGFSSAREPFDVAAAICGLDAQVIALQETWTVVRPPDGSAPEPQASTATDPLAAAADALGARLLRAPLCTLPDRAYLGLPPSSGPGQLGIAVLSTLPVAGCDPISLGTARGDTIPRLAQVVWIELADQTMLRFVNTHLTYRPFSPIQALRLRHCLRGYRGPTVVAGDLNMPRPIASLTTGYLSAVAGRTWPADRPVLQLDHVLADRGVEGAGGTVLPHAGSDHLPVRVQLGLRTSRTTVDARPTSVGRNRAPARGI